jgi:hypothetical protein
LVVSKNQNAATVFQLVNNNTGASAASILQSQIGASSYVNYSTSAAYNQIVGSGITTQYIDFDTQIFRNNAGTERMRIDTSGNLLVGTTASLSSERLLVKGVSLGGTAGNTSYNSVFYTPDTLNTTRLSVLDYRVSNGTDHTTSRNKLQRRVDSTDMGYVGFDSSGTSVGWQNTEAMRIDTGGNLLVGTTSVNYAGNGFTLSKDSGTTKWLVGPVAAAPTNFYVTAVTSLGVYLAGTSATSWSSASDERLKDIIEPIADGLQKVNTLRAVIGSYKADETKTRRPFLIAQDLQNVLPEAVDVSNPDALGVQYTEVIPLLVAAIKELSAKNDALEARLAALEAK